MARVTIYPVAVDVRDTRRMAGANAFLCRDRYMTCMGRHDHPALFLRIPVTMGDVTAGDPTMDGYTAEIGEQARQEHWQELYGGPWWG